MYNTLKPFFIIVLIAAVSVFLAFALKEDTKGNITGGKELIAEMKRNCATVEHMENMLKNNEIYKKNLDEMDKYVENYIKENKGEGDNVVITIPTVVHVIYNSSSPIQNISHAQILTQIKVLNDDFRRRNSDTTLTPGPFKPIGADVQVEFCLAKRDPSGNPSVGVTRTATSVVQFGVDNTMKFTATGGHDVWDRSKYLNIWTCNLAPPTLGFAEFPGGSSLTDGVVIGYQYFGTIGTAVAPFNLGRTTTHEVGHWLYLYHIWGDDGGSCGGSDQCEDTPNQGEERYNCPAFPVTDGCSPSAPGIMFMNYMDYTDDRCMNIFTADQSTRMNTTLSTYRAPLLTSNGCTPVSGVPIAMLSADSLSILYGGQVHYSDVSAGIPTSWTWSFPGGNPPASNAQNPTVTYSTPGLYNVSLRVSNTHGSDSITYTNYIRVRGAAMNLFNVVSPPNLTRLTVAYNDPTLEHFTWQRTSTDPNVYYKFKIKKLSAPTEYTYLANNSGHDSVISIRRSLLDSLAVLFGTTGDSVRCTWRGWSYNGVDSVSSQNALIVTLVRGVIGIQKISTEIPGTFALHNNYPNPFNPETKIKFDIPKQGNSNNSFVSIKVFDILGREVTSLVNEELSPGRYSVDWNAANYTSGIYFYRIEAGSFTDTKKMILVK